MHVRITPKSDDDEAGALIAVEAWGGVEQRQRRRLATRLLASSLRTVVDYIRKYVHNAEVHSWILPDSACRQDLSEVGVV